MNSKKFKIALVSIAIIVAVSVVGVTFAVWDITTQNNNFNIKIGYNLDFKIINKINDGDSLKNFAPIVTSDITEAVISAKLASFDVVNATTNPADTELSLTYTNVTATYTVLAGDVDLSDYVDLYLFNSDDYTAFVDGGVIPNTATLLAADTLISHSVAGVKQGIVIAWKAEVLANDFSTNKEMVTKIANKTIKVTLDFNSAIAVA